MMMKINTKMEMKMKISRRRFAETLGAVAMAPPLVIGAEEKPLARLGVITDTHIGNTKASCARDAPKKAQLSEGSRADCAAIERTSAAK